MDDSHDYGMWRRYSPEYPATAKEVLAEEPDALFIATGSELITPPIPGIDGPNVANVIDTDTGKAKTGQKVVVCGGGSSGCECALALAMEGKDVTIVDMLPVEQFGKGMAEISLWMMQSKFIPEYDIKLVGDCKVVAISEKGVEVEDRNWNHRFLEADTVVAPSASSRTPLTLKSSSAPSRRFTL